MAETNNNFEYINNESFKNIAHWMIKSVSSYFDNDDEGTKKTKKEIALDYINAIEKNDDSNIDIDLVLNKETNNFYLVDSSKIKDVDNISENDLIKANYKPFTLEKEWLEDLTKVYSYFKKMKEKWDEKVSWRKLTDKEQNELEKYNKEIENMNKQREKMVNKYDSWEFFYWDNKSPEMQKDYNKLDNFSNMVLNIMTKKSKLDIIKAKYELSQLTDEYKKLDLENKKSELDEITGETQDAEGKLLKKSLKAAKIIDDRLIKAYKRIRENARNGLAVVTIQRDSCGGCFNKIPPQRQLDIASRKKIIVCEYCGRILVDKDINIPIEEVEAIRKAELEAKREKKTKRKTRKVKKA